MHVTGTGRFNVDSEILGSGKSGNRKRADRYNSTSHSKFLWQQYFTLVDQGFRQSVMPYS